MPTLETIRVETSLLLADIDVLLAQPAPSLNWPMTRDCLGGPAQAIPSMVAAAQSIPTWSAIVAYHDRMQDTISGGSVLFVGDSHFAGLSVCDITIGAVNLGIGGDTMRGVMNRLSRHTALRRAGAGVLLIGVNDLAYESANYGVANALGDIDLMSTRMAAWMTGYWVIVKILPVASSYVGLTNALIDQANAIIGQRFGANPACHVLDMKPTLAPGGSLLSTFASSDGLHLSPAGSTQLKAAIRDYLGGA